MNDNQEYFVFGSNMAGRHGKGAALYAAKKHGAETGIGEGIVGSSYALPTKGYNLENLDFKKIDAAICRFLVFSLSLNLCLKLDLFSTNWFKTSDFSRKRIKLCAEGAQNH